MSEEVKETAALTPPKWLTKAEKFAFHRLVAQREAAGKPVSATETDALADLVTIRTRLADLRRLYRDAMIEYRQAPYDPQAKMVMSIGSRIDATTAATHRQARRLGLGPAD